jgi:hypothetical protein
MLPPLLSGLGSGVVARLRSSGFFPSPDSNGGDANVFPATRH